MANEVAQFELVGSTVDYGTALVVDQARIGVPSGDQQQVTLQLDALQSYYQQLWELHDQIEKTLARTEQKLARTDEHADVVAARGRSAVRIANVDGAVQTSRRIAGQHSHGLTQSLMSVRNLVQKHLSDLYESYSAYLSADTAAADELDRVAGQLGTVPMPSPGATPV